MSLIYKEQNNQNISSRIQNNLLPFEKEIDLPSIPVEEIYRRLSIEIENPEENSDEILRNIIYAQYYLNDPNIIYNNFFQSFIRRMRNIIINPQEKYSMQVRIDALYLIDRFMQHKNCDSIHFVCSLDIADGFLTLLEVTTDESLNKLLLRFFWLLAGHCPDCNYYLVGYLINLLNIKEENKTNANALDKIDQYVRSLDKIDEELKYYCIIFLKNLCKFPTKFEITKFCIGNFLDIIISNQDFRPSQIFVESIFGLCLIIQKNKSNIWRPLLQSPLSTNINSWLTCFTFPDIISAFLTLIYHWYLQGEILEDLKYEIIINFMTYFDESYESDIIDGVHFFATRAIYAISLSNKLLISRLIEKNLLGAAKYLFSISNFMVKKSIADFSSIVAINALASDLRIMVDMGFLNIFTEYIDPLNPELTCNMLKAIFALFRASQQQNGNNICINLIQQIPEFEIIYEVANSKEMHESTELARLLLDTYFPNNNNV